MHLPRFVFVAMPARGLIWILVSPNNRPLGRSSSFFSTYTEGLQAVGEVREQHASLEAAPATVQSSGQWSWRVDLAGRTVAVSSRSYLRVRECQYNLDRFLAGVPTAEVVAGTRGARGGHPQQAPA